MTKTPLPFKSLHAYALYFFAHLVPASVAVTVASALGLPQELSAVGHGGALGFALFRLSRRFFEGQHRIVLVEEARILAFMLALYSSGFSTLSSITLAFLQLRESDYDAALRGSPASFFFTMFLVSFTVGLVALRMFLSQAVQSRTLKGGPPGRP
jgi:hypothetical protein